jgi:hypothetical protein
MSTVLDFLTRRVGSTETIGSASKGGGFGGIALGMLAIGGAMFIKTHGGTRIQRDWQTRKEVEAESLETLRSWLIGNDPNGSYTDEDAEAEGWDPMTHDEAVTMVLEQSEIE